LFFASNFNGHLKEIGIAALLLPVMPPRHVEKCRKYW